MTSRAVRTRRMVAGQGTRADRAFWRLLYRPQHRARRWWALNTATPAEAMQEAFWCRKVADELGWDPGFRAYSQAWVAKHRGQP